jgi:hypothetical protein
MPPSNPTGTWFVLLLIPSCTSLPPRSLMS